MKHLVEYRFKGLKYILGLWMVFLLLPLVHGQEYDNSVPRDFRYERVIDKTARMVYDGAAQSMARRFGLHVLNVTWEDTGRYKNSSVGPNISDMTIQVQSAARTGRYRLTCMPVIRYPNFSDKTADISPDKFYLLVGNEKHGRLRPVSLTEYLGNFRKYLSNPRSWRGRRKSLLANRDSHVLVSAQACFLPVPYGAKAEFNPVIFNYQSYRGNPAVLAILATREGTSATVIDNTRDAFEAGSTWGQRLFFNQGGERASLTGQRISDFRRERRDRIGEDPRDDGTGSGRQPGLNMVMLIQVPLKHRARRVKNEAPGAGVGYDTFKMARESNVEAAVIGHGEVEGPYTEIDGLAIERDPRFPIRVTVQFYKATDNGVVSQEDMRSIRRQIDMVYKNADYVGSLVTEGITTRPTEYDGNKTEPRDWWGVFWNRYDKVFGKKKRK